MRPRRCRRIRGIPKICYFKPAGIRLKELDEIILNFEEYEAVRLIDFEEVGQIEAGKKMGISQPTLSRLLKIARKKLTQAIVKGKAIRIQGGNYEVFKR
ncbi:DUF134 domain-containing protein [Candidatus Pacearchaeota archaeon]|nr:DUF134 domain-containing protein [Candidatus Pacearchaeota archaeon]